MQEFRISTNIVA